MTNTTRTGKRSTEEEILSTWKHVVPGSLRFDDDGLHAGKQTIEIRTRSIYGKDDGNTRRVATSDLFQCFWTIETKSKLDKARRSAKRKMGTKSRDEGIESLRGLDAVEKAQVSNCLRQDHVRIVKAKAVLAEEQAKLDAKQTKPKSAKPKSAKPKSAKSAKPKESTEERKARLLKETA